MKFNEHQLRLWRRMINFIDDFRKYSIQFDRMVGELEGALYAGEFKDEEMIREWYKRWGPFEEFYAVQGNRTTVEEVHRFLIEMELFLNNTLQSLDYE